MRRTPWLLAPLASVPVLPMHLLADAKVGVVFDTRGFGLGDAAEWGKTRDELEAEMSM